MLNKETSNNHMKLRRLIFIRFDMRTQNKLKGREYSKFDDSFIKTHARFKNLKSKKL